MNKFVAHGWISEMEEIEDYFFRWGTGLEKAAAKKSKKHKRDLLPALPAIGATVGGAAGYSAPHRFSPKGMFPRMKVMSGKGRALSALIGAGFGATVGWLPSAYRDAYRATRGKK